MLPKAVQVLMFVQVLQNDRYIFGMGDSLEKVLLLVESSCCHVKLLFRLLIEWTSGLLDMLPSSVPSD